MSDSIEQYGIVNRALPMALHCVPLQSSDNALDRELCTGPMGYYVLHSILWLCRVLCGHSQGKNVFLGWA